MTAVTSCAAVPAPLPATGFVRLPQIIGKKPSANDPGIPGLVPVAASTIWQWVRNGQFPKPVKIGPRTTAWKVEDVRAYLEQVAA